MSRKTGRSLTVFFIIMLMMSLLVGCSGKSKEKKSIWEDIVDETADNSGKIAEEEEDDDDDDDEGPADDDARDAEDEEDDQEITEDMYKADASEVFEEMSDWAYTFSSGAGGWFTELSVYPDGSFSGTYHDSDMGSTGTGYSNGTVYMCDFSGHFSSDIRYAGPLMYCLTIEDMDYENEPGTEEIKDEVLYVYTTPYGLEDLAGKEDALVFMAAGAVTSALNKEEIDWLSSTHFESYVGENWDYVEDKPDELPFAAIINTVDQYGFSSHNISDKNKIFLVNKVKLPGLKNTRSELNDDGTYCYEDENAEGTFKVINMCFPVRKSYDMYNEAEELVKDSLKEIYGKDAPADDELYVISPKDAYYMHYPDVAICGGHSDYAFWYPDGDEGRRVCDGRFVYNAGGETGSSYVYAYIIEAANGYPSKSFPDSSFANYWIGSLTLTGKSEGLSSAGEGKGAVSVINCDMKVPKGDKVSAREIIMVGVDDTEMIKKYNLEDADFYDDYEIVVPDKNYRDYDLADGDYTPFYVQYPEDNYHRLYYAYDIDEYMNRFGDEDENSCMMYLYLNEDGEVVYGFEEYTP